MLLGKVRPLCLASYAARALSSTSLPYAKKKNKKRKKEKIDE